MKFIFTTLFSVAYGPETPPFGAVKNYAKEKGISFDDPRSPELRAAYLEWLYSDARMSYHLKGIESLTIPSIVANLEEFSDAEWHIFYSDPECPTKYVDRLRALVAPHPQIKLIPAVDGVLGFRKIWNATVKELKSSGERFCTIRCDDDDALCPYVARLILDETKRIEGPFIYHCSNVRRVRMEEGGSLTHGELIPKKPFPFTQGLASVDMSVWALGNHTKIPDRFPDIPIIENADPAVECLMNCDVEFTASAKIFK